MGRHLAGWGAVGLLLMGASGPASEAKIREAIVKESIANYPGNCPCPYNTDRAGRSCGRRSAYSRPGGQAPRCFPVDVTKDDIAAYRQEHSQTKSSRN